MYRGEVPQFIENPDEAEEGSYALDIRLNGPEYDGVDSLLKIVFRPVLIGINTQKYNEEQAPRQPSEEEHGIEIVPYVQPEKPFSTRLDALMNPTEVLITPVATVDEFFIIVESWHQTEGMPRISETPTNIGIIQRKQYTFEISARQDTGGMYLHPREGHTNFYHELTAMEAVAFEHMRQLACGNAEITPMSIPEPEELI